jgi:hypothetical protein
VVVVEGASDDILTAAAFQAEGTAKADSTMPVDTGFMWNAVYGIGPEKDHRGQAQPTGMYTSKKTGQESLHVLAPEPDVPEHTAALHGAAHYTIYQEIKHGFMYRALQAVTGQIGGIIRQVGKERFG